MVTRLLWITPKWPLPAQDGARLATQNLLRALADIGVELHLLAIAGKDERTDLSKAIKTLGLRSARVIERRETSNRSPLVLVSSLIMRPWVPLTMRNYASKAIKEAIRGVLLQAEKEVDAVVYDGLHSAIHSSSLGKFKAPSKLPIIYRAHNREATIWDRKATKVRNPLLKAFFSLQAFLVRRFEDSFVKQSRGLASVSPTDLSDFSLEGGARREVVPIGYDFTEPLPYAFNQRLPLLFLGKLDWPPNREGLVWFLESVWPVVSKERPELELIIAGSGDGAFLSRFTTMRNVTFLGRVPEVEEVYRKSVASIVPIFYGSGTRVKVIEASKYGRASISTALGVEGTGLKPGISYLHAENSESWIKLIRELKTEDALACGLKAFDHGKAHFGNRSAAESFLRLVDDRSGGCYSTCSNS